jgi:hypothetical protein
VCGWGMWRLGLPSMDGRLKLLKSPGMLYWEKGDVVMWGDFEARCIYPKEAHRPVDIHPFRETLMKAHRSGDCRCPARPSKLNVESIYSAS